MTQIQKRRYAYSIASFSVLVSFSLWTVVIASLNSKAYIVEQGITWEGIITHSEVSPPPTAAISPEYELVQHEAAPLLTGEISEHITANVVSNVERNEPVHTEVQELDTWEISSGYRLQIPVINVEVPVLLPSTKYWNQREWELLEEQMQVGLTNGAVAYPHSVPPGNNGTIIIAGHSSPPDERAKANDYGSVFSRVPDLEIGDEIRVYKDGKPIIYAVEQTQILPASATHILEQQSDESLLKIITCFPVGTTKDRFVVTAKRVGLRNM